MDIGHRGAFIHQDKDMRDMRKIRTRTPQHGVKRLFDNHTLGNIQHNAILGESSRQRGKFPFFHIDVLPIIFASSSGYFCSAVSRSVKITPLLRQLFIKINLCTARRKDDLSAMLVSNQGFQQIFAHCRKIGMRHRSTI